MKCYIAGKITGYAQYRYDFADAQMVMEFLGYEVFNPAILPGGFTHGAYMEADLAFLRECDAVCFLPNWTDSEGARIEMQEARRLRKKIIHYDRVDVRRKERCACIEHTAGNAASR